MLTSPRQCRHVFYTHTLKIIKKDIRMLCRKQISQSILSMLKIQNQRKNDQDKIKCGYRTTTQRQVKSEIGEEEYKNNKQNIRMNIERKKEGTENDVETKSINTIVGVRQQEQHKGKWKEKN